MRWLAARSWGRLAVALSISLVLTFVIVGVAATALRLQVNVAAWSAIVALQYLIQFVLAMLSGIASGGADDDRAADLATFSLALAGLASIIELPILLLFSVDNAVIVERASETLLGAVICSVSKEAVCVSAFRTLAWGTATTLLTICVIAAFLLGSAAGRTTPHRPQSDALMFLAGFVFAGAFLAIHPWNGTVEALSAEVQPPDRSAFEVGARGGQFVVAGAVLMIAFLYAAVAVALQPRGRLSTGALDAGSWLLAALVFLAKWLAELAASFASAVLVLAVALVGGWGVQQFWSALIASVGLLWAASRDFLVAAAKATVLAVETLPGVLLAIAAVFGIALLAFGGALLIWWIGTATKSFAFPIFQNALTGLVERASEVADDLWEGAKDRPRWTIGSLLVLLLVVIFVWLPRREPIIDEPLPYSPLSPDVRIVKLGPKDEFTAAAIDCSPPLIGGQAYWAFDSSSGIALSASGCQMKFEEAPKTILVLGAASRDDTRQGGFDLSVLRGRALADVLQDQFPNIPVVIAALGRDVTAQPAVYGVPEIYQSDRRVMVFASDVYVPPPLEREPLSQTISELLIAGEVLKRYETCVLFRHGDAVPAKFRSHAESPTCMWSN